MPREVQFTFKMLHKVRPQRDGNHPEVRGTLSDRHSTDQYADVRQLWERWRKDRRVLYDVDRPVSKETWWVLYELEQINRTRTD